MPLWNPAAEISNLKFQISDAIFPSSTGNRVSAWAIPSIVKPAKIAETDRFDEGMPIIHKEVAACESSR
jgi:hypothetical protein